MSDFPPYKDNLREGESYFRDKHKGKRGISAAGKVLVFGLLKRNSKAFTVIIHNGEWLKIH
ncbi:MAG: hypothetical protein KUG50_00950 [Cycloclasticus sp.]|nr:hypothetical protein [Cycloclasticus sp.]